MEHRINKNGGGKNMDTPLKAIGFSKIQTEKDVYEIIPSVMQHPTRQVEMVQNKNQKTIEYLKKIAERTYVLVRASILTEEDEHRVVLEQCDPYIEARENLAVQDIDVDDFDDEIMSTDSSYFVACEHIDTGMQIIFSMQNIIEYVKGKKQKKEIYKINLAALAYEGTIVLPIEKDEEEEKFEKEERDKLKSILKRAREGDEEARSMLEKEEEEIDKQLKERLREEDFLSVMSGYFICDDFSDPIYEILGEIKEVETRTNIMTKEEMYVLVLDVNDMPLEVIINKNELIGFPSPGMRFMGTCWLQGQVMMK
jgi:hypothetical protein